MNAFTRFKQRVTAPRHEVAARTAFALGHLDEALPHARALYEFDLANPWANFLLACHSLEAERYDDALPHLERVAQNWPDDEAIFFAIGLCHDHLRQPRAAIRAYRRCLRLAPDWAKALKNIGRSFYLLGEFPAAEDALRAYCAAAPDDKEAHDLLGYLCYRQGKYGLSYRHYEQARRLDPLNPRRDRNARLLYGRSATS